VERAAHSLKGALLNMAADVAAAIALQLEKMGREKALVDTASVVADLEREMGR
jgi:HPt (histidine-containing phosphotransfer) domain-containing protein